MNTFGLNRYVNTFWLGPFASAIDIIDFKWLRTSMKMLDIEVDVEVN